MTTLNLFRRSVISSYKANNNHIIVEKQRMPQNIRLKKREECPQNPEEPDFSPTDPFLYLQVCFVACWRISVTRNIRV